jgi:hypothetical protein
MLPQYSGVHEERLAVIGPYNTHICTVSRMTFRVIQGRHEPRAKASLTLATS